MNFLIIYYEDGTKRYFGALNIRSFQVNKENKIASLILTQESEITRFDSSSKVLQDQVKWELI